MLAAFVESPLRLHFRIHFQFPVRFHFGDMVLHENFIDLVDQDRVHPFILQVGTDSGEVQVSFGVMLHREQYANKSEWK